MTKQKLDRSQSPETPDAALAGDQEIDAAPAQDESSADSPPPADDREAQPADESPMSMLEAALTAIEAELAGAAAGIAALERQKAELTRERDAILEALESGRDPNHTMNEIQRYLHSQQQAREARGEQWRRVRSAGIDLKALMPTRPAIDASRVRAKSR